MNNDSSYTLAYSPCPNDTYILAALTNGLLPDAPRVRTRLDDIQQLNSDAARGAYPLTKVSYGAIPHLMERYRILRSGGALGRGCGPLVVTKPGRATRLEDLKDALFAIPGERTTAFMVLQLALGVRPHALQMRFDTIISAVASGQVDAGLIIHESRFTYQAEGLVAVADLGDWWESASGLPLPLGAILVRDDVPDARAREFEDAIRKSLAFARTDEAAIIDYVREHAFEMDDDVMRKHIGLYVNEYSDDVGETGVAAVRELFKRASDAGIVPSTTEPRFL